MTATSTKSSPRQKVQMLERVAEAGKVAHASQVVDLDAKDALAAARRGWARLVPATTRDVRSGNASPYDAELAVRAALARLEGESR